MLLQAVELLKDLSENLAKWYSECDCYGTSEMKKYEYKIDAFLDTYYATNASNAPHVEKCLHCDHSPRPGQIEPDDCVSI